MTNEEREQLPAKLRELARAFSPEEHCRCDIEVGFICDLCGCSFWMLRAAEEIERLAAVSDIAIREATKSLVSRLMRADSSYRPLRERDYFDVAVRHVRCDIERLAEKSLRQKDTSEQHPALTDTPDLRNMKSTQG